MLMLLSKGHNCFLYRSTLIKRLVSITLTLMVALSSCTIVSNDTMEITYYYNDNRDIVLSVKGNQYFFSGSGEEYEWIVTQFGQTGPWELNKVESYEDALIYDNQGRFYVEYKENSISIGRKLYISCWLEFIDESNKVIAQ